jgi:hypothetical protein
VARPDGRLVSEQRLAHERGAFQQFLVRCEPGSSVAATHALAQRFLTDAALAEVLGAQLEPDA